MPTGRSTAACAAIDAGADLLEVGLPYSDPLADGATLQRASQGALAAGATFERSLALVGRIVAARPEVPVVAMGYANQLIGGGDGRDRAHGAGQGRRRRRHRRRSHAGRGRAVRGRRGRGGDRRGVPRRSDLDAGSPGGRGGPERRVPLLRLAGRRDRRPQLAPVERRQARARGQGRVTGAGGRGLRGLASPPTCARSPGRARTASSWPRRSSMPWDPTAGHVPALAALVSQLRAATAR